MAKLSDNVAPQYDENVSYGCGEFVMKDKMLKQCLEQTTGTFDETKWKDAYLTDMLRGGGGEPVLLWENPSPTSEFAQQKVEIDLTDYIGVIIEYGTIVSTDVYSRLYVKKSDTLSLGNNIYLGAGYTQISTESRACSRSISAIDNTGITFTNCVNGLTTQNFNCVPTKIYGVKKYVVNSNLGKEPVLFQEVKLSAAGNSGNTNIKSENVDIPKGNYIVFGGRRNVGTDLSCSIGTKLQDTKNGNSLLMSTWIVNVDTTTSITLSANMIWGDDSAFQIIKIE